MLTLRQREQLRRSYRPGRVKMLFTGESPPASGRFFYRGDSGLYRAMLEAFQAAGPAVPADAFLEDFRRWGCYFVDLCMEPVDHLDAKQRRAACREGEESLARTIARLRPAVVVTVVRSIEGNVSAAAARTHWTGPMIHLPYPGRWAHLKKRFVETLAGQLRALRVLD